MHPCKANPIFYIAVAEHFLPKRRLNFPVAVHFPDRTPTNYESIANPESPISVINAYIFLSCS